MAIPLRPQSAATRVAVITVSYGSEAVLPAFLDSLSQASSNPLHIVVADNKPDGTLVAAMAEQRGATYLALSENRGYGRAVNAAAATLPDDIDWLIISNPDVTAQSGAIDKLVAAAERDSAIAAAGPRILTPEGDVYPSAREIPSLWTGIGHGLFATLWPSNPWSRRYRREDDVHLDQRNAGWLSGAFVAVRKDVFHFIGGFDEAYFMYFEDVDLGYRIGKSGYRNVYVPSAVVVHAGAHSTRSDLHLMLQAHHESARRFLFKKYPGPLLWPVRALISVGLSIRSHAARDRASS